MAKKGPLTPDEIELVKNRPGFSFWRDWYEGICSLPTERAQFEALKFTIEYCLNGREYPVTEPSTQIYILGHRPSVLQSTRTALAKAKHHKSEQVQADAAPDLDPFNAPPQPMPPLTPPPPGTPLPDLPF